MSHDLLKGSLCFLCVCLPDLSQSVAAEAPLQKIIASWNARQHQLDGINFQMEGEVFYPQGYVTDVAEIEGEFVKFDYPPQDHTYQTRAEFRLDLNGGRAFRRVTEERYSIIDASRPLESTIFPVDEVCLFNGELYKRYKPLPKNHPHGRSAKYKYNELVITEQPLNTLFFRLEHEAPLLGLGFVQNGGGSDSANFRKKLRAGDFKKVGEATIAGRRCLVLQTAVKNNRYAEYVVEDSEPFLIRERRRFDNAGQLFSSTSINYQQTAAGYLPETWQTTKFSFENGKAQTFEMRLTGYEINPKFSDDDFDVEQRPTGTRVIDMRRPTESRSYVVGDEEVPEIPAAEWDLQQEARANRNWTFLIIAGITVVVIGGVIWYRRVRV